MDTAAGSSSRQQLQQPTAALAGQKREREERERRLFWIVGSGSVKRLFISVYVTIPCYCLLSTLCAPSLYMWVHLLVV